MDIYIADPSDEKLNDMVDYCLYNSVSFVTFEVTDVSDNSYQWDTLARFSFIDDADALVFKMKYK